MSSVDTEDAKAIEARKDAHLDVVLEQPVGSHGPAVGLGTYTLEYDALPEIDLDEVDLTIELAGKRLRAPIVIGAMTGGSRRAKEINHRLARAAAKVGVGLALGSQRAMIVDENLTSTFEVRDVAPELPLLFGNVGAVQLNYGVDLHAIEKALKAVGADALNLHLNPLQEAIQPEGDTRFSGLSEKIDALCNSLELPVFAKEVGAGISKRSAEKLAALPLDGIEVAGTGGTSWARVESHRAPEASVQRRSGEQLAGFGTPTAESILRARQALGTERTVIASGGIRTGMDIAVALNLGANAAALAAPLLEAAVQSEDAVIAALEALIHELRVICFCTGSRTVEALQQVRRVPIR